MSVPAIVYGDPRGILRLPKAAIRNQGDWTQCDSDLLAHLIQVQKQIQQSRWNKTDIRFTTQGGRVVDHAFPDFESFVFAAVYFRQLFAKKDRLFRNAIDRYCQFVDCHLRPFWVRHELDAFNALLGGPAYMLEEYSVRELFDAFMYGAGVLHKFPQAGDSDRERFLTIHDKHPRHSVLFALHMSLKSLKNHVGNVALVIYRDYAHWLKEYSLPPPDTRWHERLFKIAGRAKPGGGTGLR